ncbi:zinc ribbon domain-containing protein [Shewanella sp. SM95]|uniref:zinc ribbon domain-containing protein n=1 Tax=Shewanella TaxID=22 RepID=UPI0021D8D680|nr:zinc ribbon domain-containing protein [Shewanella sp. SM95]MCU8000189.1 zinc ribbon domain-containing protein [Shewanella sp. SM95]
MALINCSECNREVSDKAESCPKCGAPILGAKESISAGSNIRTIQETSKKFKIQQLASILLFLTGFFMSMSGVSDPDYKPSVWPGLFMIVGFLWYVVNRFRIWWHHK